MREGAQAYLKRQYISIGVVGVVIFVALGFLLGWLVAVGFAIGAILSGAAGFIGMNVSVNANVRTAQAASQSLAGGLDIAFKAGAVTGCSCGPRAARRRGLLLVPHRTMGLKLTDQKSLRVIIDSLVAMGFGASLISIFARLGGGIFTRAPTWARTSSARSRRASRRMIRATPP